MAEKACDVLIVGGGTGGCAAALAASSLGVKVILARSTKWVGGQLSSQMTPPDEHPWIEQFGCTARYRQFRNGVRAIYRQLDLLRNAESPDAAMNPGGGWVSRLCYLPELGDKVLRDSLAGCGANLEQFQYAELISVQTSVDRVEAVTLRSAETNELVTVVAKYFLDATELGDLLPLAGAEYRVGSESITEFNEPHATPTAEPDNIQGFTWCFALAKATSPEPRPADYERWAAYQPPGWPGPQLSFTFPNPITGQPRLLPFDEGLFSYRQILNRRAGADKDATIVNWPQNDYFLGSVIDVPEDVRRQRLKESKSLGRSLVYWLQTEAGHPEVSFAPEFACSADGFAQEPYHREARRMVTRLTVTEQMVAADCLPGLDRAPVMPKSVGVGHYRIDLHPSANGHGYIDIPSLPFQIPLGALIPVRVQNLLPACKNLGVTHITNGCYRLHPVEWNIGEAAGLLAAFCISQSITPAEVYENPAKWQEFEQLLQYEGIETHWPQSLSQNP